MAEENPSPEGTPASAETPPPAVEPAVAPAETPAEPPVESPAQPPAETPAAEPATETPEAPPAETPGAEEAPSEAPAPSEEPPAEESPAEEAEAPEAPRYEAFNLPEKMSISEEEFGKYTGVLGQYGISQEAGQALIDLHAESLQQAVDHMAQHQVDVFNKIQDDWKQQFYDRHPQDHNTLLDRAKLAITDTIRNNDKRKAFWDALAVTGAGNHPDVIEGLAAIGKRFKEGAKAPAGLPAKANGGTPWDRRYGSRT